MTGTNLDAPARQILDLIRLARVLHVDETSLSLNGKLVWVWIFFDPETGNTLFVIRPSRGGNVLREVIPEWDGTLISDGWGPYKKYRVQRCWAHIIARDQASRPQESRLPGGSKTRWPVLSRVHRCGLRASGSMKKRRRLCSYLRRRVREILAKCADVAVLEEFTTKLGNAYEDLFRFVLDPRIPSTNNAAERGLREIVVHRKIRGSIRSKNTMRWLGNLFSCVTTWQQRGIDHLSEIARYV